MIEPKRKPDRRKASYRENQSRRERAHPARKAGGRADTAISMDMLTHAMHEIARRVRLDRSHDIPYLAGYSRDGRTIYIDRHVPRTFPVRGRRVKVDQFLILHEAVEKALLVRLGLLYQHAHQIALRAEEAAVRAAGVSWRHYDRFMSQYIKEVSEERLSRLPLDLDVKPYRDESDFALLKRMMRVKRQEMKRRR